VSAGPADDRRGELASLEARLVQEERRLEQRRNAIADVARGLKEQEEAHERDLTVHEAKLAKERQALDRREKKLASLERKLAKEERRAEKQRDVLAAEARKLQARSVAVERREQQISEREQVATQPFAGPTTAADPPRAFEEALETGRWHIETLRRLHALEPENAKRESDLVHLAAFAGPDGWLAASFDGIVRELFGDLIERSRG
jgi:chromosome segregation ATPase